jgi:hypothetical protein
MKRENNWNCGWMRDFRQAVAFDDMLDERRARRRQFVAHAATEPLCDLGHGRRDHMLPGLLPAVPLLPLSRDNPHDADTQTG